MSLPDELVTEFDTVVIEEAEKTLKAIDLIAKGPALTPGTSSVNRKKVERFTGKARRGYKLRKVPRESGERNEENVMVVEHAYGFEFHRKELQAYQSHGFGVVDTQESKESTKVVAKSIDDIILNGDLKHGVEGIYANALAANDFTVAANYEWNNPVNRNPEDTIIDAVAKFEADGIYDVNENGFLALAPMPYNMARKRDPSGARYMDGIADIFGGAENVIKMPAFSANNVGLIGIKDTSVAERNVEEEINTIPFELQPNSMYPFNVETYQAVHLKKPEAFMKLKNLITTT